MMLQVLNHRGPDDFGIYESSRISLGHRRLSIIDLSLAGRQPMVNEDGSCFIVYNGEVYNFKELRESLVQKGHIFKSGTDTEVILHQYEEDGPDCVNRFNGMFSFAIWDERKKTLFLARDRLGIKPLYYSYAGGKFVFASEMKSLIQHPHVSEEINVPVVYQYLMLRYCHAPQTSIQNVFKLPAGCTLTYRQGEEPKVSRYWSLPDSEQKMSFSDAAEQFRSLLSDSVSKRLVADVPVGVLLSGGVDSSSIYALAAQEKERICSVTIGFEGQKDNEFATAAQLATKYAANHRELLIEPNDLSSLPYVVWYNDEPVAGPSSLAYYLGLEHLAQEAKVLLLGHGADELFAGYEEIKIQNKTRMLAGFPFKSACVGLSALAHFMFPRDSAFTRLFHYTKSLGDEALNFLQLISVTDPLELSSFLAKGAQDPLGATNDLHEYVREVFSASNDPSKAIVQFEAKGWLPEDILLRVDRITMSRSIEARVPFLDHRIVEFVFNLPMQMKTAGVQEKALLREAMVGIIPDEMRLKTKQRFNTPIHVFFGDRFQRLCRHLFSEKNELNQSLFDSKGLLKLLEYNKNMSYRLFLKRNKLTGQYFMRQIWNVVVFHLWYKMYIERQSPETLSQMVKDV